MTGEQMAAALHAFLLERPRGVDRSTLNHRFATGLIAGSVLVSHALDYLSHQGKVHTANGLWYATTHNTEDTAMTIKKPTVTKKVNAEALAPCPPEFLATLDAINAAIDAHISGIAKTDPMLRHLYAALEHAETLYPETSVSDTYRTHIGQVSDK